MTSSDGLHTVTVQDPAQQKYTLRARWLIDATGRNRVLSKLLQLHETVNEQKNVFWFRLMNFDPEILGRIRALKKQNRAFVPYFATHHFFGKGNWIWCIPMRSPENLPLISIGITYRKDIYPYGEVRTMEQFLECVGREHEVIVEFSAQRHCGRHEFLQAPTCGNAASAIHPMAGTSSVMRATRLIRSTVLEWPYRRCRSGRLRR